MATRLAVGASVLRPSRRSTAPALAAGARQPVSTSTVRTPQHPEVEPDRYVMLSVSDTGTGMDADAEQAALAAVGE